MLFAVQMKKIATIKNANPKRDFGDVIVADIRLIAEGDPCPHCGAPVKMTHGIEVGQVFKLGIKYSKALGATFLDENGREKTIDHGLLWYRC